jgi:hypothetical protein
MKCWNERTGGEISGLSINFMLLCTVLWFYNQINYEVGQEEEGKATMVYFKVF